MAEVLTRSEPDICVCTLEHCTETHYLFSFRKIRRVDQEPVERIAKAFQLARIEPYVFGDITQGEGIYDKRVHPDYKSLGLMGVSDREHLTSLSKSIKDFLFESFHGEYELSYHGTRNDSKLEIIESVFMQPRTARVLRISPFRISRKADLMIHLVDQYAFLESLKSGFIRNISLD